MTIIVDIVIRYCVIVFADTGKKCVRSQNWQRQHGWHIQEKTVTE